MAITKSRKRSAHSLSHGRPPTLSAKRKPATISSQKGARLIRKHHQLSKAHARAIAAGNVAEAQRIKKEIESQGGIEAYQAASIAGQSLTRGGDSSKQLLLWLAPNSKKRRDIKAYLNNERQGKRWSMLEVGALSASNECSTCGLFDVTRIDLNSQTVDIEQQDFMKRPLPEEGGFGDDARFDIVSLSLVLNYVPDANGRGDMLRRTCRFLHPFTESTSATADVLPVPALFLVLPAPCVTNSRYMDEELLGEIMNSLGYVLIFRKLSSKLVYYLWRCERPPSLQDHYQKAFRKVERRSGSTRNNFAVTLE